MIVNNDTSLLDNSELKVLFSIDGKEKDFQEKLGLSSDNLEVIKQLQTLPEYYSQFFFKDATTAGCVGFLLLGKQEKALVTTKAKEASLIEKVIKTFPELSYEKLYDISKIIGS